MVQGLTPEQRDQYGISDEAVKIAVATGNLEQIQKAFEAKIYKEGDVSLVGKKEHVVRAKEGITPLLINGVETGATPVAGWAEEKARQARLTEYAKGAGQAPWQTAKIEVNGTPVTLRSDVASKILGSGSPSNLQWELTKVPADSLDQVIAMFRRINSGGTGWSLVWEALNKRQRRLNAEIIAGDMLHTGKIIHLSVSAKAGGAIQNLVMATRQLDLASAASIETLIGLGSGLTPSGDDLLAGYMAGLCCTVRKESDRARFLTELGKRVIDLSVCTNDISRTYLYHAVHGQVSSRLTGLRGDQPRNGTCPPPRKGRESHAERSHFRHGHGHRSAGWDSRLE